MRLHSKHTHLRSEEDHDDFDTKAIPSTSRAIYTPPEYFPVFQVCVLFFASLTGALPLTSLFPYVAYMVVDLGVAADVDKAGFVSGYVASAFMFGRLLSSFYWGHKADLIGRKPVIYISCIAIAVFSICFGFSVNIWMALIARFFLGFLNPLSSLTKTLISEICSKRHQPMGMAVAAGSWSVGLVIGPALGGSLARSADLYPGTILDNSMTRQYPYLLPNAVTALFGLVSLFLIYFYLPETMAPKESCLLQKDVGSEGSHAEEGRAQEGEKAKPEYAYTAFMNNVTELIKDPKVRTVSLAYFSISLSAIIYDECLPLWALSSVDHGGLGMNSAMIGNVTSMTGIPMLIFTFICFPILNKYFGEAACYRFGQLICNVFALLTVAVFAIGGVAKDAKIPILVLMASGEKSFACVAFTANFLLINDSVSAERRGSVNGFVMTIGGIAKTLGPMLGATFYAWSINNGQETPPFNFVFVFLCCFIIGAGTMIIRLRDDSASTKSICSTGSSEEHAESNSSSTDSAAIRNVLHQYQEHYIDDDSVHSGKDEGPSIRRPASLLDKIRLYVNERRLPGAQDKKHSYYTGIGKRSSDDALTESNSTLLAMVALSPIHNKTCDVVVETGVEPDEVVSANDDFEYALSESDVY